jgi:hypothetical protein
MKDIAILLLALGAGALTFFLVFKKFGGDCTP